MLDKLPANHQIEVQEGQADFHAKPFANASAAYERQNEPPAEEHLPTLLETWLIQPMQAPDFSLPDLAGDTKQLSALRGHFVLFIFGASLGPPALTSCASCRRNKQT